MKRIRRSDVCLEIADVAFDARLTLIDSAQVFHWRETGRGLEGKSNGRRVTVVQRENGLMLDGCREEDEAFWIDYLDLTRDYDAVARRAARVPKAAQAVKRLPGLRVLNQPPWEALTAFIISANNNVSRIRGIVGRLTEGSGGFPSPETLAGMPEEALRSIGCGYRAPYLVKMARLVADGFDLEAVAKLDYEAAHRALLMLPGVGDKVADCVQLFGMRQSAAFPVDVWVERLMKGCFVSETATKKEIHEAARALFGEDAGLIQQSLFHCARLGLIDWTNETDERA